MTTYPILALPGLLNDARLWDGQRDLGEFVIPEHWHHDSLADLADHVLTQAPARFILMGLSMGGYLAFEILRRQPDRVMGLVLMDTTARPDTPEQTERRQSAIQIARQGRFALVMPTLLPNLVHPQNLERLTPLSCAMADHVGPEGFVRQQYCILGRPDSRPLLPAITCPTLVMVGESDQMTPPDRAREMADAIPAATLSLIRQCGHLSPIEQPEQVREALTGWLATHF